MGNRLADIPRQPWAEWVRLIAALVVIPLIAWGVRTEVRLAKIEANRFTSADAVEMMRVINEKADRANVPPPEVRSMLARLESMSENNAATLNDIRERLARLEASSR